MTTRTASFSLTDHRQAALYRLVSHCKGNEPMRAIRAVEALRRMEAGDYGYCMACGMKIPEASLESRPERRHCSGCEAQVA
jgi:DnaK suppressor protein